MRLQPGPRCRQSPASRQRSAARRWRKSPSWWIRSPGSVAGPCGKQGSNLRPGAYPARRDGGRERPARRSSPGGGSALPGGGQITQDPVSASSHRPSRTRQPSQASRGETPGRRAPPARPSAASASAASRRRAAGSAAPYVSATSRNLLEEREGHQGVVVDLREDLAGPRECPARLLRSTQAA